MSANSVLSQTLVQNLSRLKENRLHRELITVDKRTSATISISGKQYLNFAGNDYLGLSTMPEICEALNEGIRLYGAGTGASAVVTGHTRAHHELEEYLKEITGKEAVILFNTGFAANQTLIKAGISLKTNMILDRLVHASMQDAVFSAEKFQRYRHNDMKHAEAMLEKNPNSIIFTEGVFSMDGDMANLKQLVTLSRKYASTLVLDDAHGFGVLGQHGRGTPEHQGISMKDIDVYMGTLSKACGLSGAFVASDRDFVDYLINTGREYIYSTAAPAFIAHALIKSLEIITGPKGNELRKHLSEMTDFFRRRFHENHISAELLESSSSIQPVIIGDNSRLIAVNESLRNQGILCGAIRPPTVPKGTARLRITITAAHMEEDIVRLTEALGEISQ